MDEGLGVQVVVSMTTPGLRLVFPARGVRRALSRALSLTWKGSQLGPSRPWEAGRMVGLLGGRQAEPCSRVSSAFLKAINSHLSCSIDLLCENAASVIFFLSRISP